MTPGPARWRSRTRRETDGPLASLVGARDAIRKLKAAGPLQQPIRVRIQSGEYAIREPIAFEPQDSGTDQCPISYLGDPDSRPIISGGRQITGWQKQGDRWVAHLPEVEAGQWTFAALWVNGERRTRARMPNEDYFYTAGKAPPSIDPTTGKSASSAHIAFRFKPGDIRQFSHLDDAVVVVYQSWEVGHQRIASVDEAKRVVTFRSPLPWAFDYWGGNVRYYVENVARGVGRTRRVVLGPHDRPAVVRPLPRRRPDAGDGGRPRRQATDRPERQARGKPIRVPPAVREPAAAVHRLGGSAARTRRRSGGLRLSRSDRGGGSEELLGRGLRVAHTWELTASGCGSAARTTGSRATRFTTWGPAECDWASRATAQRTRDRSAQYRRQQPDPRRRQDRSRRGRRLDRPDQLQPGLAQRDLRPVLHRHLGRLELGVCPDQRITTWSSSTISTTSAEACLATWAASTAWEIRPERSCATIWCTTSTITTRGHWRSIPTKAAPAS